MAYDLIIKNGTIADGSGMPAYRGDVAVKDGKIVQIGKITGEAKRVLNAEGLVVAPGVIDNHCHYDAQAIWDPICSFSSHHGATTVIIGNCSLALAPARPHDQAPLVSLLSRVEAIPIEALQAGLAWSWETIPQYFDALDRRLGVNVAAFVGHSAVRRYVMGEACYDREATEDEIYSMKQVVREGLEAGAIGLSYERNTRHFDHEGRVSPTNVASDLERYALASVLDEVGHGVIQVGGSAKLGIGLAQAGGRPVFYGGINQNAADPDRWKEDMNEAQEYGREGLRAFRLLNPMPTLLRYTLKTAQHFDALPTWKGVMTSAVDEKKRLLADPSVREKLHYEAVDTPYSGANGEFCKRWDLQIVFKTALAKNAHMEGKSVAQVAAESGRDVLDTFLDLALEEDLETVFERHERNGDPEAMAAMLNSPNILVGQSDGGAHVVFRTTYAYPTYLLGHWVREKKILSLESAVRKLSFESASVLGLTDRGLIQPGYAADLMVFNPDTIGPLEPEETQDLPGGAIRRKQLAQGIDWTLVNGEILMDHGEHAGAFPGQVVRGGRV